MVKMSFCHLLWNELHITKLSFGWINNQNSKDNFRISQKREQFGHTANLKFNKYDFFYITSKLTSCEAPLLGKKHLITKLPRSNLLPSQWHIFVSYPKQTGITPVLTREAPCQDTGFFSSISSNCWGPSLLKMLHSQHYCRKAMVPWKNFKN